MKKILTLCLIFLMLMPCLPVCAADPNGGVILAETYDDYVTHAQPDNGTFSAQEVFIKDEGRTNKKLILRSDESGFITTEYTGLSLPDKFGFTMEISVKGAKVSGDISLTNSAGKLLKIFSVNGSEGMTNLSGYRIGGLSNQKQQLTFLYDENKGIYSIYINGKCMNKKTYLKPAAVLKDLTGLKISLVSAGGDAEIAVDNLYFYEGDTYRKIETLPKKAYNSSSVAYEAPDETGEDTVYLFRDFEEPVMADLAQFTPRIPEGSKVEVLNENNNDFLKLTCSDKLTRLDMVVGDKAHASGVADVDKRFVIFQLDVMSKRFPRSAALIQLYDATDNAVALITSAGNSITAGSKTVGTLSENKFINIATVVDFATRTYDVYIDYKLVAEDIAISKKEFTTPTWWYVFGFDGEFYLDNIGCYAGKTPIKMTYDSYTPVSQINADRADVSLLRTTEVLNTASKRFYVNGKVAASGDDLFIGEGKETLVNAEIFAKAYGKEAEISDGKVIVADTTIKNVTEQDGKAYVPIEEMYAAFGKKTYVDGRKIILGYQGELDTKSWGVYGDYGLWDIVDYTTYDRPSPEQIIEIFNEKSKNQHPRILYTQEQIDDVKERMKTSEKLTKMYDKMIAVADRQIGNACQPFDTKSDNLIEARVMLSQITDVGLAYLFTKDEKYAKQIWSDVEYMCNNWEDWDPFNCLAVTETITGVAIAYDWLFDWLTDEQKELIEERFLERCIGYSTDIYYGRASTDSRHWLNTPFNQNPVAAGGYIMGSICLMDKYPEIAAKTISDSIKAYEAFGRCFYPGGAYNEGLIYWIYGLQYFKRTMGSLYATFDDDFGLKDMPDHNLTPYWAVNTASTNMINNYHDCGEDAPVGVMGYNGFLAWLYDDPDLATIKKIYFDLFGKEMNDLFFDNPDAEAGDLSMPLDSYFENIEVVNMRSAWGDKQAAFVSFHGGAAYPGHGHLDTGTFVLDMLGERFASDMGTEDYYWQYEMNRVPELRAKLFEFKLGNDTGPWHYRIRPEGHNCFIINPEYDPGQAVHGFSPVTRFETGARGAISVLDMSGIYDKWAKSAQRGVKMGDDRRSVTVRDEIVVRQDASEVYWYMQTKGAVEVVDDSSAIITVNGKQVLLKYATNGRDAVLSAGTAAPPENTPKLYKKSIDEFTTIQIKAVTDADVFIEVKFIPLSDPKSGEELVPQAISEWTIPEGEIQPLPAPTAIYANGEKIEEFTGTELSVSKKLGEGSAVPTITIDCDEQYDYEITQTDDVNGISKIRLWQKTDPSNYANYSVGYVVIPKRSDYMGYERLQVYDTEQSVVPQGHANADKLIDDDPSTWSAQDSSLNVWGELDLGSPQDIDGVAMGTYEGDSRVNYFTIEVSDNGTDWTEVYAGQSSGKTLEMEIFNFERVKARYIRFVAKGSTAGSWYSVAEFYALKKR